MDFSKIFVKDARPTKIGGQAVIDGVMMRGDTRTAVAVRLPDDRIYLKTTPNGKLPRWMKLPLIRGVVSFVASLVSGMKILTFSADVQEYFLGDGEFEEPGKLEKWLLEHFGEKKIWTFLLAVSMVFSFAFSILVFALLPTAVAGALKAVIHNSIVLNLIEGLLRLLLFLLYIVLISRMEEIRKVFQYHGAEHKTIHCYEKGLELTPENAEPFYTLHPRCGTSFLMFVMVIAIVLFSLLGWPSLLWRIVSRIVLMPVIAALSYEVLRWAGKSDNIVVEILSVPGLYLQKLTTREPDRAQLEIGITAMKAVLVPDEAAYVEGFCDTDANIIENHVIDRDRPEEGAEPAASEPETPESSEPEPEAPESDMPESGAPDPEGEESERPGPDPPEAGKQGMEKESSDQGNKEQVDQESGVEEKANEYACEGITEHR